MYIVVIRRYEIGMFRRIDYEIVSKVPYLVGSYRGAGSRGRIGGR